MAVAPEGTKLNFSSPASFGECWIDATTSPAMAALSAENEGYFEALAISACSWVNSYTQRYFNKQQADQIFINQDLPQLEYIVFQLQNRPLITVDKVFLNIAGTFTEFNLEYIQVDTQAGVLKLPPDLNNLVVAATEQYGTYRQSNIWVRFTSGYEIERDIDGAFVTNDVPVEVQQATARYVQYLRDIDKRVSGVGSFKTQTYSESAFTTNQRDARLDSIYDTLKKYKQYHVTGTSPY